MTFGSLLQTARVRAGLSQHALAVRAGIDVRYVRRLERGDQVHPSAHVVVALARECAVKDDSLLAAANLMPAPMVRLTHAADLDSVFACVAQDCLLTPTQARALIAALADAQTDCNGSKHVSVEDLKDLLQDIAAADSLAAALRADVERVTAERDGLRWELRQVQGAEATT